MARLVEQTKIVVGLQPVDANGSAKVTDWVSLENYHHCTAIILYGVSAAGTPAITIDQATVAAGTDSKDYEKFDFIWRNSNTGTTDTLVKTDVTSDTISKVATTNQMFVIEIDADSLDTANGYKFIQIATSTPGGNATLMSIVFILSQPRYASATPPTAIVAN